MMLCRTICLCLLGVVLVKCDIGNSEALEITFVISETENRTQITCNHDLTTNLRKYTVLEEKDITINIRFSSDIHRIRCTQHNNPNVLFFDKPDVKILKVKVHHRMGAVWDCEIWTYKVNNNQATVKIKDDIQQKYISPHCYMQLHVKRIIAPQMILVNNVISQPLRTDLSEQHVDFRLEYGYADNDVVEVSCIRNTKDFCDLSLEYNYAGMLNDTNIKRLHSKEALGIRIRLQSDHHNSGITCKCNGNDDYTNVQVTFIIQTRFSCSMTVSINGLNLRQKYNTTQKNNDFCVIKYNAAPNEKIHLKCESNRDDWEIKINQDMTELSSGSKMAEVTFNNDSKQKKCLATYKDISAERIEINFGSFDTLIDNCQLVVEMPKDNIVMELFETQKQRIIYYEFENSDTVTMTCNTACTSKHAQVHWKINDIYQPSSSKNETQTLTLSRTHLYRGHACYLYIDSGPIRETRIVFVEKVRTTSVPSDASMKQEESNSGIPIWVWILAGMMTCFIIICIFTVIYKMKKRNISQEARDNSNQRIPPYLENNYAVPIDQRQDDTTYSEPCETLYTEPVPKTARKKKTINLTYAPVDLPTNHRQKNITNVDPNYAVICNNTEANYAEVLHKDRRPSNPYAHLKNDTYANLGQGNVEPTYCEPTARKGVYENVVNHGHYVNITGDVDYVEPTYCETNTKRK